MSDGSVEHYRLTDTLYPGTSKPLSLTLTAGSQIAIDLGTESSFLVCPIHYITFDCAVHPSQVSLEAHTSVVRSQE